MSKGLEALKEIKNGWVWHNPQHDLEDNFEYIEQELKDKEKLDKFVEIIKKHCCVLQKGVLPQYEQDLLNEVLIK